MLPNTSQPTGGNRTESQRFVKIMSIRDASQSRNHDKWKKITQAHVELQHIFNGCGHKLKKKKNRIVTEKNVAAMNMKMKI